jgi:hypothetical protein
LFLVWIAFEHTPSFRRKIGHSFRAAVTGTGQIDSILTLGCVFVAALFLVPLYSSRFIPYHDGKVHSGGSCWADLPIHMHMAQSFLVGRNQDVSWGGMMSPVFAGEPMAYPFLPDFHAAVMVKWGSNLRWAMMLPGLLLALALIALFFTFTVRVTGSRLGGIFAILLAIGAGGMGGPHIAMRDGFAKALTVDTAQNDTSGDGKIVWFAFIPHVLLPQRGANFAYPMVLFVLTLVWVATDMRKTSGIASSMSLGNGAKHQISLWDRRVMLIMSAAFAGMLPLIQAHSFVALAVMISVQFALDFHKWIADPRLLVSWGMAGIVAVSMGYPQMFLFQHQVQSGAGGHFLNAQWWYQNHEIGRPAGFIGFFRFWWMNLGPALPLCFFAISMQIGELILSHLFSIERKAALANGWDSFYSEAIAYEETSLSTSAPSRLSTPFTSPPSSAVKQPKNDASIASPHVELQMRIQHLDIEYTLPDPALGDGSSTRFKLALPAEGTESRRSGPGTVVLTNLDTNKSVSGSQHAQAAVTHTTSQGARAEAAFSTNGSRIEFQRNVADAFATYRDPKNSTFFVEHLWHVAKASLRESLGVEIDPWLKVERYGWDVPDRALFHLNALTISGRGLDLLKLAIGALGVFFLGNAINFQPWDRDNTKLFYVWVFVNASLSGALIAAPFEYLFTAFFIRLSVGGGTGSTSSSTVTSPKAGSGSSMSDTSSNTSSMGGLAVEPLPGFLRLSTFLNLLAPTSTFAQVLFVAGDRGTGSSASGGASMPKTGSLNGSGGGEGGGALSAPRLRIGLPKRLFPESALKVDASQLQDQSRRGLPAAVAAFGAIGSIPTLLLTICTGFMMIYREYGSYHVLLDEEQLATGAWIIANTPPKAVFLHKDVHITPAGCLAGRPTLVAYNGWMWSHGYNYGPRDADRAYVHENSLKDSDPNAYNAARRWGVRYILGESMPRHHRPEQQRAEEAKARGEPSEFDSDLFLDKNLKRVYQNGRFDLLEVLGYGFPPT